VWAEVDIYFLNLPQKLKILVRESCVARGGKNRIFAAKTSGNFS
jgi:hypothetical protein